MHDLLLETILAKNRPKWETQRENYINFLFLDGWQRMGDSVAKCLRNSRTDTYSMMSTEDCKYYPLSKVESYLLRSNFTHSDLQPGSQGHLCSCSR